MAFTAARPETGSPSSKLNVAVYALFAILALLALGWAYGAIANWGEIASRPVRLAYLIADFALVIPAGIVSGLLRDFRPNPGGIPGSDRDTRLHMNQGSDPVLIGVRPRLTWGSDPVLIGVRPRFNTGSDPKFADGRQVVEIDHCGPNPVSDSATFGPAELEKPHNFALNGRGIALAVTLVTACAVNVTVAERDRRRGRHRVARARLDPGHPDVVREAPIGRDEEDVGPDLQCLHLDCRGGGRSECRKGEHRRYHQPQKR